MSVPRYDSYRDSGVEWLGEVPSHWAVVPLKAATSCNDEVLGEASDPSIEIEYIEISDVSPELGVTGSSVYAFSEAPSRARRIVRDGDVIVSTVRTYLRAIAPIVRPPANLIASTGFAVIRPRRIAQSYLGYLFFAEYLIAEIISRSAGVSYPAINASEIMRLTVPLPPLPEQAAIAAFLDRETAKIDALVEEQRRLIALLAEKRQAVISHAVTKGLDPTVPMKDSGVEWLGEVPAHWEVKRLKHLGCFSAGAGFPDREQGLEGEALSFHKVNALGKAGSDGYLLPSENTISIETALRLRAFVFPPDAIVFAKIGAALLLGRLRVLRVPACLDNNMMGFVVQTPNKSSYIRYLMSQIRFDLIANPGAVPSLNESQIANLAFAIPCSAEQEKITTYLDNEILRSDALTAEAQSAITLLQERRAALISAAVTGKIDVRGLGPAVEEAA
ncbi:restriction endonuclease subunit S [Xanthobacter sp. VTT E-85241]|uniref:restriction endonuclease subunit S n=1 Tax=Roseixanthobacter finlandensis TaxID=3119922 RepID=UPI0037291057